jgi:predicted SnoaL-like aldol condensation-catalyzing enzyme
MTTDPVMSTPDDQQTDQATVEHNRATVLAFINMAFSDHQVEEAVARYVGSTYIQHNPRIPDGIDGLITFASSLQTQFPMARSDVKRTIAQGDLVVVHSKVTYSPDDRGTAAVDIFRLEHGKIVEHWDILQEIPVTSANSNTMF